MKYNKTLQRKRIVNFCRKYKIDREKYTVESLALFEEGLHPLAGLVLSKSAIEDALKAFVGVYEILGNYDSKFPFADFVRHFIQSIESEKSIFRDDLPSY